MGERNTTDYLLEFGEDQDIILLAERSIYTYHDLRQACACIFGEFLSKDGVPGDRVGILGDNSLFLTAAYLASMKLGAIAVPFPTVYMPEDFTRNINFIEL